MKPLNDALSQLAERQWHQVINSSRRAMVLAHLRKEDIMSSFNVDGLTGVMSNRTVVALASRATPETAHQLHKRFLAGVIDDDSEIRLKQIKAAVSAEKVQGSARIPHPPRILALRADSAIYLPSNPRKSDFSD